MKSLYIIIQNKIAIKLNIFSENLYNHFNLHFPDCYDELPLWWNDVIYNANFYTFDYVDYTKFLSHGKAYNLGVCIQYFKSELDEYYCVAIDELTLEKHYIWLIFHIISEALQGKGYFILHASAVCKNEKALLICGEKGSGKSTLARYLVVERGYKFLGDEFIVLDINNLYLSGVCSTSALQSGVFQKDVFVYDVGQRFFNNVRMTTCVFPHIVPLIDKPHVCVLSEKNLIKALAKNVWGRERDLKIGEKNSCHSELVAYLITTGSNIKINGNLLDKIHEGRCAGSASSI